MKTTTSLIDLPAAIEEVVGSLATPCECPANDHGSAVCPSHPDVACDAEAKWMLRARHATRPDAVRCEVMVRTLCDPCFRQVRRWAEQAVDWIAAFAGGRCPHCGERVTLLSDLIVDLVAL